MLIKEYRSPIPGVTVRERTSPRVPSLQFHEGENFRAGNDEFSLMVPGVGRFYARAGEEVEYTVEPGADEGWVRLYLNGQLTVALLHQRGIITFHASSFIHAGRGVMILGESGAGKSSLTASFSLNGASFMTDDVTPVLLQGQEAVIWPLHDTIRIRKNTAEQLKINCDLLTEAETGTDKQYLSLGREGDGVFPIGVIMTIEIGNGCETIIDEPSPHEKFALLRSEICMSEMLAGMPETEVAYMHQLLLLIEKVPFVRIVRPSDIGITDLHRAVEQYLTSL